MTIVKKSIKSLVRNIADTNENLLFDSTTATYTASVVKDHDTKSERLAVLQKKISDLGPSISAAPESEPEAVEDEAVAATSTNTLPVAPASIDLCPTYRTKTLPALTGTLQYSEQNGSRIFYINTTQFEVATTATTNTVVFTLPLRTTPLSFTSCIATDIVAVTTAGAPIHNADYAKYQGLGEGTLIGYTLDGFPLYGATSNLATDSCGGTSVGGAYRYYLSDERAGVLGCYAGIPIAL